MTSANQAYVEAVLAKCAALKSARLWAPEPTVRPRGWLNNFRDADQTAAALLLDSFTFFSEPLKAPLLAGAFDAAVRIPRSSPRSLRVGLLDSAVFTGVLGTPPNPTDSAFPMSRMVRQQLGVAEDRFVSLEVALDRARSGTPVVFVDDVTITGDQFMSTWTAPLRGGDSFASVAHTTALEAICIYLIATTEARDLIEQTAPPVRVFSTHCVDGTQRLASLRTRHPPPLVPEAPKLVDALLDKYAPQLRFRADDSYMHNDPTWAKFGYKQRGLLFALENNVSDGTLPIFWADGPTADWIPLVRRT